MLRWIPITLAATATGIFLLLLLYLYHRFFRHRKPPPPVAGDPSVSQRGTPEKALFKWSDHPELITDAIENGWSRFAFTDHVTSSSVRSNRFKLSSCAAGGDVIGGEEDADVDIIWEVCHGSVDLMQKIRLNVGLKKIIKTTTSAMCAASVIRSSLPLPGPTLGNSSPFPQEAYFEITVLFDHEKENGGVNEKRSLDVEEDENIKLIQENGVSGRGVSVNFEQLRGQSCAKGIDEGGNEVTVMLSVGLTSGGSVPVKLPGSYPGSVGFYSDGSVYLDGIKLVSESNVERWERNDRVIGCGYKPGQKKVYFTRDSKLVHEINCKGDEFATPLYPTLAANGNVTVLVNFGQTVFKYTPANVQRTQNPCFIGPIATSSSSGYEDSKELFSMGKIDSQWLNQTTRSGQCHGTVNRGKIKDYDEASEGDLFEIAIESNSYRKSPTTMS